MSYYMGDFYRGDPGIGSFFSGLVKKAVGFIPGVGPAASAALGAIMPGGSRVGVAARPVAGAITAAAKGIGGAIVKHPVLSAAGAAGAIGAMAGAGGERLLGGGLAGACPRGFHISKSRHAKHFGACVRNRRMNSCNPRALRRAVRRLHSFAKHYRKVVSFSSPHPKKGRMYFRKKKK